MAKRIRDYGITIGRMQPGERNKITDVPEVKVGHVTIKNETHNTGLTVIVPGEDNSFSNKYTASCYVHNGFGKSAGLVQIQELGTLETPIALTNTLNVGLVWDGVAQYVIDRCVSEGVNVSSLNPVVGECNDSRLSQIQVRAVRPHHVQEAIAGADVEFAEGDVGAGTGTLCYGLKGGIGSSSRIVTIDGKDYVIGVLVQSNFGSTVDLTIEGRQVGPQIMKMKEQKQDMAVSQKDRGSIMTIVATDLPVSCRQLHRIIRRTAVGIARTGAYSGHGSGEVMIGFTTANRIPADDKHGLIEQTVIHEDLMDQAFRAAAEAANEAILNSMVCAGQAVGRKGEVYYSLAEFLPELLPELLS